MRLISWWGAGPEKGDYEMKRDKARKEDGLWRVEGLLYPYFTL